MSQIGRSVLLALLLATLAGREAHAQLDGQIRILAIYNPDAAAYLPQITRELDWLRRSWAATHIAVPIIFANGGAPALSPTLPSGDAETVLGFAQNSPDILRMRGEHQADVILAFTPKVSSDSGST